MKSLARGHIWWPSIDKDIEDCMHGSCQITVPLALLHPWVWPGRPWQRVHVDFAGPINGKMFILLVDAHSKWPEVFEMPNTTSQNKLFQRLQQLESRHLLHTKWFIDYTFIWDIRINCKFQYFTSDCFSKIYTWILH